MGTDVSWRVCTTNRDCSSSLGPSCKNLRGSFSKNMSEYCYSLWRSVTLFTAHTAQQKACKWNVSRATLQWHLDTFAGASPATGVAGGHLQCHRCFKEQTFCKLWLQTAHFSTEKTHVAKEGEGWWTSTGTERRSATSSILLYDDRTMQGVFDRRLI